MGVRITETLDLYPVGHEDYILFKDAKPNSIRQAARKLLPKTFDVSELGQVDRTIIKRIS